MDKNLNDGAPPSSDISAVLDNRVAKKNDTWGLKLRFVIDHLPDESTAKTTSRSKPNLKETTQILLRNMHSISSRKAE